MFPGLSPRQAPPLFQTPTAAIATRNGDFEEPRQTHYLPPPSYQEHPWPAPAPSDDGPDSSSAWVWPESILQGRWNPLSTWAWFLWTRVWLQPSSFSVRQPCPAPGE